MSRIRLTAIFLILTMLGLFGVYSEVESWHVPTVPGAIFGGRILFVRECICNVAIALFIGPPRPAVVTFQLGLSIPHLFGQFYRPGPLALGNYLPGVGICSSGLKLCVPTPTMGAILHIGTSLF